MGMSVNLLNVYSFCSKVSLKTQFRLFSDLKYLAKIHPYYNIAMLIHFATPSKQYALYIKRYWAIVNILEKGEICVQWIISTDLTELILYFTPRPIILTNNKYLSDNITLYGQQNECVRFVIRKRILRPIDPFF